MLQRHAARYPTCSLFTQTRAIACSDSNIIPTFNGRGVHCESILRVSHSGSEGT
jgi:hypothetical protein